jgi:GWxTD domain-containing protein
MTLLETWVESPVAEALGWTLLHFLWEGAIIAAALGAVLPAMRSPRARYAAACAALLAMLGAFGITLLRVMPESTYGPQSITSPLLPAWNVRPDGDAVDPWNAGLAAAVPWLAPLWVAGVWISYLWHVAGWIAVRRLRRRGVCCASERWQKHLAGLSARLRLSRPVELLESCLVDAPLVLGHFRPLILLPIGLLTRLPAGQIEAILLHELAHIRRCDYLVNVLQRAVEGLLFYHPAVWWVSRVIRAERENCCDDVVVAMSGDAPEYAAALAALEQDRWSAREPAVAATGGSLVKRIRRLLHPKGPNGAWTPLLAAVVLMASAALTLAAWPAAPPPQGSAAQAKTGHAESSPFFRWLDQDVVYIITAEERAAFERLTSDPERERFIERFWQRRDPTPNTVDNEFRDEHYHRIQFANQRFPTASGKPGWQTDRGRIYIVYGPPDEIEAHPSGGPQRPYPFQSWRYWHVEGIGDNLFITFLDRTGSGDYQVAPGNR